MSQPISNLTADWIPSTGIQLQWTAATDVTNASVYNIYVLEDVLSYSPTWILVGTSSPYVASSASPGTAVPVFSQVVPPVSAYTFPLALMNALQAPGSTLAPNSFAFSVIHVDGTGVSSTALSVSVFQNPQHQIYGIPHFQNSVGLDGSGQMKMNPQDSYAEISSGVAVFLGTLPGQRTAVPDYGTPDLPFSQLDLVKITQDINYWDDRADATVTAQVDDYDNATLSVNIQGGQGGTQ